ncbi:putative molybdenum cofactor guanylyltransferase [Lentibacillus populi]|uniref:Probable molybdenum cofactor guanylyltransferase n=1 Tax=Lentibacillus populi TaxID=1827502 RepID=A0A9W5U1T5_9BACI|nr:molybdenum cofactor guanylyltransferase [Lentibacillus populi]GGB61957.1 putative molybdenum cofactor guanylyltransferase [Lentibacillus populi]
MMNSCGVILSGGKSSRMGENKSLLPLNDKPVIEHIANELTLISDKVIVVTNEPSVYTFLDLPLVADRYFDKGPLAGLETALYHHQADVYFVTACDMPFINRRVYSYLQEHLNDYDAVIPIYENQLQPLAGIYRRSVLPVIQRHLDNDNRKVLSIVDDIRVNYIHEFGTIPAYVRTKHFFNMNNPAQYEQAKLSWKRNLC